MAFRGRPPRDQRTRELFNPLPHIRRRMKRGKKAMPADQPYVPHNGTSTSKSAAESMKQRAPSDEARTLAEIQIRGSTGATCDEIEQALDLSHQNASARIRGLALKGKIKESGYKRPTRSGRPAIVWIATEGVR